MKEILSITWFIDLLKRSGVWIYRNWQF